MKALLFILLQLIIFQCVKAQNQERYKDQMKVILDSVDLKNQYFHDKTFLFEKVRSNDICLSINRYKSLSKRSKRIYIFCILNRNGTRFWNYEGLGNDSLITTNKGIRNYIIENSDTIKYEDEIFHCYTFNPLSTKTRYFDSREYCFKPKQLNNYPKKGFYISMGGALLLASTSIIAHKNYQDNRIEYEKYINTNKQQSVYYFNEMNKNGCICIASSVLFLIPAYFSCRFYFH